jgi:hypothetical protein
MLLQMGAANLFRRLAWARNCHPELWHACTRRRRHLLERSTHGRSARATLLTLRRAATIEWRRGQHRLPRVPATMPGDNRTPRRGSSASTPTTTGAPLADSVAPPARELVSTFGHGRHSCPAQRFSISAIRIAIRRLLERYALTPLFTSAAPRRRQIGGIARAARPCLVGYTARSS